MNHGRISNPSYVVNYPGQALVRVLLQVLERIETLMEVELLRDADTTFHLAVV